MLYLVIILIASILLANAALRHPPGQDTAQAEVCIEQPPGVIHCGNDSPISPLVIRFVYLPLVWK